MVGGAGGSALGGGLLNVGGSVGTLDDSLVARNAAVGGVGVSGGDAQGGGVFSGGPTADGTPSLTITRSLVSLNRAVGGPGGIGSGGGLYLAPGGVATADASTVILYNLASTGDDVFGDLG